MIKPGATVIDVGTNRTDDGLVGDVDFEPAARSPMRSPRSRGRRADDDRDAAGKHPASGLRASAVAV